MAENIKTKWAVDPNHSQVQFKVKHLAISNVSGTFQVFSGSVQSENEDFSDASVYFEIDTNSIDTNHSERDSQLKSNIFFNTLKYPKIFFNGFLKKENGELKLVGDLTILETTKSIVMEVEHTGSGIGRFGDIRTGFEVYGKINRRDYGLNFSLMTDAGNLVVGNEIKLHFDIQLIKQATGI
jgi:polyisoprenoid-binding protein YceI